MKDPAMTIFRFIDGICRPLEIDNSNDENFCRSSKCPKCGSPVFFIRHNGGSVWIDSLGYPWPKHSCFDKLPGYQDINILKSACTNIRNSLLGLVLKSDPKELDTKITIRCSDNKIRYYVLGDRHDDLCHKIVTIKRYESDVILSTMKNNSIKEYIIPTVSDSKKYDLLDKSNPNLSKILNAKKKLEKQKAVLRNLGVEFKKDMTSKEIRELLKKENERRRNVNISSVIKKLSELKIHLKGNESYSELKKLKKMYYSNNEKY